MYFCFQGRQYDLKNCPAVPVFQKMDKYPLNLQLQ